MEDKVMSTQVKTNSYKKNAVVIAILFIIATAFLFVGDSFYGPVLDTPDYLQVAYPNRISATIGMLIEFSCILAIPADNLLRQENPLPLLLTLLHDQLPFLPKEYIPPVM